MLRNDARSCTVSPTEATAKHRQRRKGATGSWQAALVGRLAEQHRGIARDRGALVEHRGARLEPRPVGRPLGANPPPVSSIPAALRMSTSRGSQSSKRWRERVSTAIAASKRSTSARASAICSVVLEKLSSSSRRFARAACNSSTSCSPNAATLAGQQQRRSGSRWAPSTARALLHLQREPSGPRKWMVPSRVRLLAPAVNSRFRDATLLRNGHGKTPIGKRAMTPAERQQRRRKLIKKEQGGVLQMNASVWIDGIDVEEITLSETGTPLYRGRIRFRIRTRFDQDDQEALKFDVPFQKAPNLDEAPARWALRAATRRRSHC